MLGVLAFAGLAVAVIGFVGTIFALIFTAPLEHQPYFNDAQRDAVVLTRLTGYQTFAIALAVIYCAIRSHAPKEVERREFFTRRGELRQLNLSIVIAGLILGVGSAAVLIGVSFRLPNGLLSIGTSVLVAGSLGWFAVALCRRAMVIRVPRLPAQTAKFLNLGVLILLIPLSTILYGPVVLDVSEHLAWLGPLGRINAWLYELANGRFAPLLPLGTSCAALAASGYAVHRSAGRWTLRRRLLSMTLVIERDDAKRSGDFHEPPAIARDLRDVLAGRARWSWRSIVCPRWLRGSWATLLVIAISLFTMQAFMIAMGLLLTRLEAANDVGVLPEKLLIFGFASSTAAWSVLSMEVAAACYRDGGKLVTFAFRPVSPWDLWLDIQRDGLAFVPTQILYSLPFIAILALFSRDYLLHGAAVVGIALLACTALRSLLIAGTCLTSVVTNLRFWIRYPLQWITAFGGSVVILLTIGQAVAVPGDGAVFSVMIRQLVLNFVALVVLAVAAMAWHVGAEPVRKSLH